MPDFFLPILDDLAKFMHRTLRSWGCYRTWCGYGPSLDVGVCTTSPVVGSVIMKSFETFKSTYSESVHRGIKLESKLGVCFAGSSIPGATGNLSFP